MATKTKRAVSVLGKRERDVVESDIDNDCPKRKKMNEMHQIMCPRIRHNAFLHVPPTALLDFSLPLMRRPIKIEDLLSSLCMSVQGDHCQLENLLSVKDSDESVTKLCKLTVPKTKSAFKPHHKKAKTILVPDWIELENVRFVRNNNLDVLSGGYGVVAFYVKVVNLNEKPELKLPESLALKIGRAPFEDLETLMHTSYDLIDTKMHWIREFVVQRRLKWYFSEWEEMPFVQMFGACVVKIGSSKNSVQAFTAMEAGMCDLFQLCQTYPLKFNQKMLITMMASAAESLEDLHSIGFHHGDVKLSNILVDSNLKRTTFMDFDGSVFEDEDTTCDTFTREYLSPQRLLSSRKYNRSADDNWALGVSFLIALTLQKSPIKDMNFNSIKAFDMSFYFKVAMLKVAIPQRTKRILEEVVCGLLHPEEDKRWTAGHASKRLKTITFAN